MSECGINKVRATVQWRSIEGRKAKDWERQEWKLDAHYDPQIHTYTTVLGSLGPRRASAKAGNRGKNFVIFLCLTFDLGTRRNHQQHAQVEEGGLDVIHYMH